MPDNDFSNTAAGGAVQECPPEEPSHWLEIELHDEEGFPVPYEEYLVTLPGADEPVRGYLDETGWARLEPIEAAGTCSVTFPNIDARIWDFEKSAGPRQPTGVEI